MSKTVFLSLSILLLCLGCAGPALTSRVVQQDSTWFVRLDSYQEAVSPSPRYEHPAMWTIEELSAILSRLLLEDRVGLMDSARPPRPVFSLEEILLLVPAIRDSFQKAGPNEWVSFLLSAPSGSGMVVTSGGMFLAGSRLHIAIANHRTPLTPNSEDLTRVRANPFHSIRGSGGSLTFESSRFVMGTQANWSGGHRASASELILDHQALLSFLKLPGAAPSHIRAVEPSGSALAPVPDIPHSGSTGGMDPDSTDAVVRLQEEVERLKKKVQEQEAEIARLKRGTGHPPRSRPSP
jgi:hypothetical protein